MKKCIHCEREVMDDAHFCPFCGCTTERQAEYTGLDTAIKVFLIMGAIATPLTLYYVPVIWCVPLAIIGFRKISNQERISKSFKICILLLVSVVAGILLLCRKED